MSEPDAFSRHEVYDRAALICDLWAGRIMEHKVVADDPELAAKAEAALEAMMHFYQFSSAKLMNV